MYFHVYEIILHEIRYSKIVCHASVKMKYPQKEKRL